MYKVCPLCSTEFRVKPSHFKKRKYCSKVCFNISKVGQTSPMKGREHSEETKKLISDKKQGFKHSEETKQKMKGRKAWNKGIKTGQIPWNKGKRLGENWAWNKGVESELKDDKHPNWKGNKVSYRGLHHWIVRKLGTPSTCEFCKKSGLSGKKIHWANKSQKYLRDTKDWIRLCAKCHNKYDREFRQAPMCQ